MTKQELDAHIHTMTCVCVCVCTRCGQRYLQLFPGVCQVVDLVVEVAVETAAPQRLGSAQQAALLGLHHHQLNMAALQTEDARGSRQDATPAPLLRPRPPSPPVSPSPDLLRLLPCSAPIRRAQKVPPFSWFQTMIYSRLIYGVCD